MNEVMTSKITGEEERYSHIDLVDFKANLDGSVEIVTLARPMLEQSDPALARTKLAAGQQAMRRCAKALARLREHARVREHGLRRVGATSRSPRPPSPWLSGGPWRRRSTVKPTFAEWLGDVPVKVTV